MREDHDSPGGDAAAAAAPHPRLPAVVDRDERLRTTLESMHCMRLSGLSPSHAAIRDACDYVEGRRTLDELIDDVIRRHTRPGQTGENDE